MRAAGISAIAVVALVSCTTPNPEYCDLETSCADPAFPVCDIDNNRCVPAVEDAGLADSSGSPEDAGSADARPTDASQLDASPPASWDIAYIDDVKTTGLFELSTLARVVNTGAQPLDLSSLEVASVTHDGPASAVVEVELGKAPLVGEIPPGQAAGSVTGEAGAHVTPLVSEPVADDTSDLLHFSMSGFTMVDPPFTITANVTAGGSTAVLEISVEYLPLGALTVVSGADRVSAVP